MWTGRAADHSLPPSAAVKEELSYTSTHPLGHTRPVTGSLYLIAEPVFCLFVILFTTTLILTKINFLNCICKFSSYCAVNFLAFSCNKRGNVLINATLKNFHITIFAVEKQ